jgi:hypothetical protein
MAFVCTAGKSQPELIGDSVVVPIGYDDAEPASYSLLIGFDTLPGGDAEYFFCLIKANHAENTETRYWSGLEVAKFTSREDRILIRSAVLEGTQLLLNYKAPDRVFCCAHDADPPEKALQKLLLVAVIFKTCGYAVERKPICLGKHSWWMERQK